MGCKLQKLDLCVRQGSTNPVPIRVESDVLVYVPILNIHRTAPVSVETSVSHNMPDHWKAVVMNAQQLTELNAQNNPPKDNEFRVGTIASGTMVEFNKINGTGFRRAHLAGTGHLVFYRPLDLDLYVGARAEVKDKVGGNRLALFATALTLAGTDPLDGVFEFDAVNATLWLRPLPDAPWDLAFKNGVIDIELLRANGEVDPVCSADSTFLVNPEVTTAE